jgi:adenylate kinase
MTARLLIVGPQGSGKGTQGIRIADAFGIPAISTGDMFRAAVASGSELGTKVTEIIQAGDLVPDELTSAVVSERLSQPDAAHGFLLDGYPATWVRSPTSTRSSAVAAKSWTP